MKKPAIISRRASRAGGVYPMHANGSHFYKVGRSRAVFGRLAQLRFSGPFEMRLLAFVPCPRDAAAFERVLLRSLAAWRVRGEWFAIATDADIEQAALAMTGAIGSRTVFTEEETRRHYGITESMRSPAVDQASPAGSLLARRILTSASAI